MDLDDRDAMGITLATIDAQVCWALGVTPASDFGRGYNHAMRQIKAILDKHGAPPSEPVHFGNLADLTQSASSGVHAPERLAACLREWQATAEIHADPAEADRLRRALREADEGMITPWVFDEASA